MRVRTCSGGVACRGGPDGAAGHHHPGSAPVAPCRWATSRRRVGRMVPRGLRCPMDALCGRPCGRTRARCRTARRASAARATGGGAQWASSWPDKTGFARLTSVAAARAPGTGSAGHAQAGAPPGGRRRALCDPRGRRAGGELRPGTGGEAPRPAPPVRPWPPPGSAPPRSARSRPRAAAPPRPSRGGAASPPPRPRAPWRPRSARAPSPRRSASPPAR